MTESDSEDGTYLRKHCQLGNPPSMEFVKTFVDSHRLVLKKPSLLERSRDNIER